MSFRDANRREEESYTTFLVEEEGYSREEAEDIVENSHIGMFEGNLSLYVSTILIVFRQDQPTYELYGWAEQGNLTPIDKQ